MKNVDEMLKTHNMKKSDFDKTNLTEELLKNIYDDYVSQIDNLKVLAKSVNDKLLQCRLIHLTRMRVKDPDHLLAKIIRKKIDIVNNLNPDEKYNDISVENYKSIITDLVGVRAIHILKENWIEIHKHIDETWDYIEKPVAYLRFGDQDHMYKDYGCDVNSKPSGYRSVHYIISELHKKNLIPCEIQVRTIFEEGWGEISHIFEYPNISNDPLLNSSLLILSRLAGAADEMSENIQRYIYEKGEQNKQIEKLMIENDSLREKVKKGKPPIIISPPIDSLSLFDNANLASTPLVSGSTTAYFEKYNQLKFCSKCGKLILPGSGNIFSDLCDECSLTTPRDHIRFV